VGDYDGSPDMNEKNMMKEIRARGPITVGIIMPVYATYYKSGILTCKDVLLPDDRFTETQEEIYAESATISDLWSTCSCCRMG
jgi:hypothetical protein